MFWCRHGSISACQTVPRPSLSLSPPSVISSSPLYRRYFLASSSVTEIIATSLRSVYDPCTLATLRYGYVTSFVPLGYTLPNVIPERIVEKYFSLVTPHSSGISPIHSTPLSFIFLGPRTPWVTASVIMDCFSFLYSSMVTRVAPIFDQFPHIAGSGTAVILHLVRQGWN